LIGLNASLDSAVNPFKAVLAPFSRSVASLAASLIPAAIGFNPPSLNTSAYPAIAPVTLANASAILAAALAAPTTISRYNCPNETAMSPVVAFTSPYSTPRRMPTAFSEMVAASLTSRQAFCHLPSVRRAVPSAALPTSTSASTTV